MNDQVEINFTVCKSPAGQFVAFMDERMFYTERFFYFMDQTGNHEVTTEQFFRQYKPIRRSKCSDAFSICILLRSMNNIPELMDDFLNTFNQTINQTIWKR